MNYLKSLASPKALDVDAEYVIVLLKDVVDAGVVISDVPSNMRIDFGAFTYTLTDGSSGIVIEDTNKGVEIVGGTISSGTSFNAQSVITGSGDIEIKGTMVVPGNMSASAIEVSKGSLSLSGNTSVTGLVRIDSAAMSLSGSSKVDGTIDATNYAEVSVSGSSTVSGNVNAERATVNVSGSAVVTAEIVAKDQSDVSFSDSSKVSGSVDAANSNVSVSTTEKASLDVKVQESTVSFESEVEINSFEKATEFDSSEVYISDTAKVSATDYSTMGQINGSLSDDTNKTATISESNTEQHNHSWAVVPEKAASCTAGWSEYWKCEVCGEYDPEHPKEVISGAHTLVHHDAQSPTCENTGWDAYDECSVCGYSTKKIKRPLEHSYVAVVTAPGAETEGYTTYTCSRCSNSFKSNFVPALGHSYGEPVWKWDENYSGAKATFTDNNDSSYSAVVDAVLKTDYLVAPSCETNGRVRIIATVKFNGSTYSSSVETVVPPLGHDKKEYPAKEPTCTGTGWEAFWVCLRCGQFTYSSIPALGHDYDEGVTTEPTTESEGYTTRTCKVCGVVNMTDYVPALDHTIDYSKVESWQWNSGYTGAKAYFRCTTCEEEGKTHLVHLDAEVSYSDKVATCMEEGLRTYTATVKTDLGNFADTRVKTLPKISHDFTQEKAEAKYLVKSATCTEPAVYYKSCPVCGEAGSNIFVYGEPLGHDWTVKKVVEPTTSSKGYTEYVCSRCSETKVDDYVDILIYEEPQWSWASDYSGASAFFACSNSDYDKTITATVSSETDPSTCIKNGTTTYTAEVTFDAKKYEDKKAVELPLTDHSWDSGIVTIGATYESEGERTYTCTVCGATKTEVIPKLVSGGSGFNPIAEDDKGIKGSITAVVDAERTSVVLTLVNHNPYADLSSATYKWYVDNALVNGQTGSQITYVFKDSAKHTVLCIYSNAQGASGQAVRTVGR